MFRLNLRDFLWVLTVAAMAILFVVQHKRNLMLAKKLADSAEQGLVLEYENEGLQRNVERIEIELSKDFRRQSELRRLETNGVLSFQDKNFKAAVACFKMLHAEDPKRISTLHFLADAHDHLDKTSNEYRRKLKIAIGEYKTGLDYQK